jgi:hypothetical protein
MTQVAAKPRTGERAAGEHGRFDLYAGVHKGVRSLLADTLLAVGRMDLHDPAEFATTLAQARGLIELCRAHMHIENQFVHPAMEARRPGSTRATAADHQDQLVAMEQLEAGVRAVERARPDARAGASSALYRDLALFLADNYTHMTVEEDDNNAVLWDAYSDEELSEIHQAIIASMRPETMLAFLRWMVPAMSPVQRAGLLGALQLGAPRPVFEGVLTATRPHLGERDWTKLLAALAPMPVLA